LDERSSLGTVSKRGCFFRNARARNTHVEATLNLCPAQARFEPQRTADDVDEMNRNIMDDQSRIASLRKRIDQTVADRNDTKLANFKQHATMISRKLSDKENELEKLEGEHAKVTKEIEQQETLMTELGGAKFMTRDEFKKFGNQLREKTHVYKKLKAELGELRAESVTLHRTEQILRGRVANLEVFLTELEARRGVRGYRDTQDKLERASEQTAEADAMKEKTLEEISNMVRSITQQLKEKKNDLAPQIKKLREVRNSYQIVETDFLQKKATYDKVAVGLDVERQQLEHECDAYQEEALQEESRFHYLNCLTSMAEATLKRIDDEEGWKAGKGRGLLPNFKCYEDLYTNKLAQQQAFSDQLRKQRATIEKHEGPNMKQRAVYADLEKLLAFKLKIVEDDTAGQMGFASTEYDLGNARVAQFSTL
jgi:intraflagellar transport protein 81